MDIVIYMREEDFRHKTDPGVYAYWSMGRVPKNFETLDKIYIAVQDKPKNCAVMGFVVCDMFNPNDLNGETLEWDGAT